MPCVMSATLSMILLPFSVEWIAHLRQLTSTTLTSQDDNELLCLVNKHGPRKWAVVARALKTKSSKQVR